MTELYNSLSAIGYKKQDKSAAPGYNQFNHDADKNDPDHLDNLNGVMSQHGYRSNPSAVNPTYVNKDNDEDSISLHDDPKSDGHRLFHDKPDMDAPSPEATTNEGFELFAQHPSGAGPKTRATAKTNKDVENVMAKLRTDFPKHHITVRNRHTGVTSIFKPKKVEVDEGLLDTAVMVAQPLLRAAAHAALDKAAEMGTNYATKKINDLKNKTKKKLGMQNEMQEKTLKEMFARVDEGLKKIGKIEHGPHHATIYRDHEWEEYRVKFHKDGKHLPNADYHTDDKEDAHDTAKAELKRMNENLNENYSSMSKEAKELVLHADNDRDLHRQSKAPIQANLSRKMEKGVYDHARAQKLWMYHADRAAHSYTEKHGGDVPWHKQFSTSVRREAAKHWADHHKDQMNSSK
jgi:hypothetical protein